jgi:hypothetical protein
VGRELVALLCDPKVDARMCFGLSEGLGEVADAYLVPDVLRAMEDERLPWQQRWLMGDHLERFAGESHDGVIALIERAREPEVRTCLAAAVGAWGEPWVVPLLREGLRTLPPDLTLSCGSSSASHNG